MKTRILIQLLLHLFLSFSLCLSIAAANDEKNRLSEDVSKFEKLGLSFKKPNKWLEKGSEVIIQNIKRLDAGEVSVESLLANHRGSLVIASLVKNEPSQSTGPIPTINVLFRANPAKSPKDFKSYINSSVIGLKKILENVQIVEPLNQISLSGKEALYFKSTFDISLVQGASYSVVSQTYSIPMESGFLQVSMSEQLPGQHEKLFSDFINSLEFY